MTQHLDDLIRSVHQRAALYAGKSDEQKFSYACEDIADEIVGTRQLLATDIAPLLQKLSHAEDIDVPQLYIARQRSRTEAAAFIQDNALCFFGRNTTLTTVLHEIAHLSVRAESHGVLFRDEMVRLTRQHHSVEYAALLHSLYTGLGLDAAPWPASAHQK